MFKRTLQTFIYTFIIFSVLAFTFTSKINAQVDEVERIKEYFSTVKINTNGSIDVEERLTFNVQNISIKRGIYRDIPTYYITPLGFKSRTRLTVNEVLKNGLVEPYIIEPIDGGDRIKIGNPNVIIPIGEHTYTIKYTLDNFLLYFDDHDELYYNVNGTGWNFSIDVIKARVILPEGVDKQQIQTEGFSGLFGEKNKDFVSNITEDGGVNFVTNKKYLSGENLTIVVGFPKNHVTYPSKIEDFFRAIGDNFEYVVALFSVLYILFLSFLFFHFVGKDPQQGIVIPEFKMPENVSAGLVRYVNSNTIDNTTLISNLFGLASKGAVKIENIDGGYHVSVIEGGGVNLLVDEKLLLDEISKLKDGLVIDGKKNKKLADLVGKYFSSIKGDYQKYLSNNSFARFLYLFLVAFAFIITSTVTLVSSFFVQVIFSCICLIVLIVIVATFLTMPKRTKEGRKLQDQILGIKEYISTAEEARILQLATSPKEALSLFEKFFPFALALGIELKWIRLFENTFKKIQEESPNDFRSLYYISSFNNISDLTKTTSSIESSIKSTIAKEMATNSYSSRSSGFGGGGGGGGSSGGGGGGGGGGGW